MQKRNKSIIFIIILILFSLLFAEEDSNYDYYLPEIYEMPSPFKLFYPKYIYIESGVTSLSDFLFYTDFIDKNINFNSHLVFNTRKGRFATFLLDWDIFDNKFFHYNTFFNIKTSQYDSMNTRILFKNSFDIDLPDFNIAYNNYLHLLNTSFMDMFHNITYMQKLDDFSLFLDIDLISINTLSLNTYRLYVLSNDLKIGIAFYNLPFPYFSMQKKWDTGSFSIDLNIKRKDIVLQSSPFSLWFYENSNFIINNIYNADIQANYLGFSFNSSIYTIIDSVTVNSYGEIINNPININVETSYSKKYKNFFLSISPGYEYSTFFKGFKSMLNIGYMNKYSGIVIQHSIYPNLSLSNIVNLLLITGNKEFKLISGIKNIFDTENPYYHFYAPSRSFFISIAAISGIPFL